MLSSLTCTLLATHAPLLDIWHDLAVTATATVTATGTVTPTTGTAGGLNGALSLTPTVMVRALTLVNTHHPNPLPYEGRKGPSK